MISHRFICGLTNTKMTFDQLMSQSVYLGTVSSAKSHTLGTSSLFIRWCTALLPHGYYLAHVIANFTGQDSATWKCV